MPTNNVPFALMLVQWIAAVTAVLGILLSTLAITGGQPASAYEFSKAQFVVYTLGALALPAIGMFMFTRSKIKNVRRSLVTHATMISTWAVSTLLAVGVLAYGSSTLSVEAMHLPFAIGGRSLSTLRPDPQDIICPSPERLNKILQRWSTDNMASIERGRTALQFRVHSGNMTLLLKFALGGQALPCKATVEFVKLAGSDLEFQGVASGIQSFLASQSHLGPVKE